MRKVFSAMRRSLMSAATCLASSRRGARRHSRSVSRTEVLPSWKVSVGVRSSKVIVGFLGCKNHEGSRLPVSPHRNPCRSTGSTDAPADLDLIHLLFGCGLHRYH